MFACHTTHGATVQNSKSTEKHYTPLGPQFIMHEDYCMHLGICIYFSKTMCVGWSRKEEEEVKKQKRKKNKTI